MVKICTNGLSKAAALVALLVFPVLTNAQPEPVPLNWLGGQEPAIAGGVSWGLPWPRGAIKKDQAFTLTDANGGTIPLQSWPLAYWPDGSLKWIGFAAPAGMKKGPFKLSPGGTAASATQMQVSDQEAVVRINTGPLQCIVPKSGGSLIDSLQVNGQVVAGNARMQCILQQGPDGEGLESPEKKMYFSKISKVTLEQQGPVRTVVRIQGTMESEDGERSLFPYIVRLYF